MRENDNDEVPSMVDSFGVLLALGSSRTPSLPARLASPPPLPAAGDNGDGLFRVLQGYHHAPGADPPRSLKNLRGQTRIITFLSALTPNSSLITLIIMVTYN